MAVKEEEESGSEGGRSRSKGGTSGRVAAKEEEESGSVSTSQSVSD